MFTLIILLIGPSLALRSPRIYAGISTAGKVTKVFSSHDDEYNDYTISILGDLHLDPRFMDDHIDGRNHFLKILEDGKRPQSCVGEYN